MCLPREICHDWGKEVFTKSLGMVLRLDTFMWANKYKRHKMSPQGPVDPIAREHL